MNLKCALISKRLPIWVCKYSHRTCKCQLRGRQLHFNSGRRKPRLHDYALKVESYWLVVHWALEHEGHCAWFLCNWNFIDNGGLLTRQKKSRHNRRSDDSSLEWIKIIRLNHIVNHSHASSGKCKNISRIHPSFFITAKAPCYAALLNRLMFLDLNCLVLSISSDDGKIILATTNKTNTTNAYVQMKVKIIIIVAINLNIWYKRK